MSQFRSSGYRSQRSLKRELNLLGEWRRFWACEGDAQGGASSDSAVQARGSAPVCRLERRVRCSMREQKDQQEQDPVGCLCGGRELPAVQVSWACPSLVMTLGFCGFCVCEGGGAVFQQVTPEPRKSTGV